MATTNDSNAPDVTAVAADTTPGADTGADAGADVGAGGAFHTEHGYISDKSRYLARLMRIEG